MCYCMSYLSHFLNVADLQMLSGFTVKIVEAGKVIDRLLIPSQCYFLMPSLLWQGEARKMTLTHAYIVLCCVHGKMTWFVCLCLCVCGVCVCVCVCVYSPKGQAREHQLSAMPKMEHQPQAARRQRKVSFPCHPLCRSPLCPLMPAVLSPSPSSSPLPSFCNCSSSFTLFTILHSLLHSFSFYSSP